MSFHTDFRCFFFSPGKNELKKSKFLFSTQLSKINKYTQITFRKQWPSCTTKRACHFGTFYTDTYLFIEWNHRQTFYCSNKHLSWHYSYLICSIITATSTVRTTRIRWIRYFPTQIRPCSRKRLLRLNFNYFIWDQQNHTHTYKNGNSFEIFETK